MESDTVVSTLRQYRAFLPKDPELVKAYDEAITAVNDHSPAKVIYGSDKRSKRCGKCGRTVFLNFSYCPECGSKLIY